MRECTLEFSPVFVHISMNFPFLPFTKQIPLHQRIKPIFSTFSPSSTLTAAWPLIFLSVEQIIQRICLEQHQSPPHANIRFELDYICEEVSFDNLRKISTRKIEKSFICNDILPIMYFKVLIIVNLL